MASFTSHPRFRIGLGVLLVAIAGVVLWLYLTSGRESTDDAQVEAHVTQIAARVGGTILHVNVVDNQQVAADTVLVELDPRDYQVARDKARAELADAEATAIAAQSNVPITTTTTAGNVTSAKGSLEQARAETESAQKEIDAAHARLTTAQAKLREAEANSTKAARDVERLRGLLAKDEVSQQQFDAAVAAADAQRASADSSKSQITEAEAGIRVAESKLVQAKAGEQQAQAGVRTAQTGPEQVTAMRARASSAEARIQQSKAALEQAELNLQYASIHAPVSGIVSRKIAEVGQIVQAGQPLMALIPLQDVWIIANFKETQLTNMRPGQRATVTVDAYGGKTFKGHVDSLAAATGARFSLLPPENATGNYVKVVQRVPVKIVIDNPPADVALGPGMSVVPSVRVDPEPSLYERLASLI
jgi:membrane fusion protein (multidrug efflux system)